MVDNSAHRNVDMNKNNGGLFPNNIPKINSVAQTTMICFRDNQIVFKNFMNNISFYNRQIKP